MKVLRKNHHHFVVVEAAAAVSLFPSVGFVRCNCCTIRSLTFKAIKIWLKTFPVSCIIHSNSLQKFLINKWAATLCKSLNCVALHWKFTLFGFHKYSAQENLKRSLNAIFTTSKSFCCCGQCFYYAQFRDFFAGIYALVQNRGKW